MKASTVTNGHKTHTRAPRSYEGLTRDDLLTAYRWMVLSRRLDDKEIQLKNQSQIFFQISGAGHEAILVAAGLTLKPAYDWFFPYYRDRALTLMLGMTPYEMLLSAVGSSDDPSSAGRMMPSHWSKPSLHIMNRSSATGMQCLQGAGSAEASKRLPLMGAPPPQVEQDEVTYVSIGDGATGEGEFWEFMNTICTEQLPVVCVVEDNGYAISCPAEYHTAGGDISRLVESFPHLEVIRVDGTDLVQSYRAMREAVAYARARKGPALVHAKVIRPYSHSHSDDERNYKTAAGARARSGTRPDREPYQAPSFGGAGHREGARGDSQRGRRRGGGGRRPRAESTPARARDRRPLRLLARRRSHIRSVQHARPSPQGDPITMVSAINRTLRDEMERNPLMVVFGQDVADASKCDIIEEVPGKGGVFKATHGLQRTFGNHRVFNSPLAEANIVGRAIGMAVRGLKPVVEIQFFDYIWPAMMQIRDELSMLRYRSANTFKAPSRHPRGDRRIPARAAACITASPARASSRTAPGSESRFRRRRAMPPDCCARPSAATTR